jgi:hypothetical protein
MHDLVHAESPVLSSPARTRPDQEMTPGIEAETVAQVIVVTGSPARITSVSGSKAAAMPLPSQTPTASTASTASTGFSEDTISKLRQLLPEYSDEDDEDDED